MNMQQMLMQAQKMQRQMSKAQEELAQKEFSHSANGGVTIKMNGKREIIALDIDTDLLNPESYEMLQDMIKVCFNSINKEIDEANEKIQEMAAGQISF